MIQRATKIILSKGSRLRVITKKKKMRSMFPHTSKKIIQLSKNSQLLQKNHSRRPLRKSPLKGRMSKSMSTGMMAMAVMVSLWLMNRGPPSMILAALRNINIHHSSSSPLYAPLLITLNTMSRLMITYRIVHINEKRSTDKCFNMINKQ